MREKRLKCMWMDDVELDLEEYVCNEMEKKEPWTEQNGRLS